MSSKTDQLEREAEARRSDLDSTLEAIRERLSVGQIIDEFTGYLKEGQGADTVKNLGRQVRDNPLALGLVGAGLAWLVMGSGVRSNDSHGDGDIDAERAHYVPPTQGRTSSGYNPYSSSSGGGYGSSASTHSSGQATSAQGRTAGQSAYSSSISTSERPGTTDRLSHAASSAKDAGSRTAHDLRDKVTGAASKVSDTAGSMYSSATGGVGDAASRGRDAGRSAMHGARNMGRGAYRAGSRARRNIVDLMEEEPLVFGAIALAIGAAAGAMLPATRSEDKWMGDLRDHVRDDAYAQGEEWVDSAKKVASESYEAASQTAEDKGLKGGSGSSDKETIAEKVASVAKAATDTAKDTSKKEEPR